MVSSGIWGFKLAKMLRSGVSVCGVLLQLLLLGIRASSSGVGRINHSLGGFKVVRSQDRQGGKQDSYKA